MTQAELNKMMQNLCTELWTLKIPISKKIAPVVNINIRARRRLGCCRQERGSFIIEVSEQILDDVDRLRQTLAHELLHTCPGCQNHGKLWKTYAERVNTALCMSISRLAPPLEDQPQCLRNEEVKYALQCESCGKLFHRSRMCPLVRQPWRYRCPCGGRLGEAPSPNATKPVSKS